LDSAAEQAEQVAPAVKTAKAKTDTTGPVEITVQREQVGADPVTDIPASHPPVLAVEVEVEVVIQVDKQMMVVVVEAAAVLQQVVAVEAEVLTVAHREETAEVLYSEAVPVAAVEIMPAEHTPLPVEKEEHPDKKG